MLYALNTRKDHFRGETVVDKAQAIVDYYDRLDQLPQLLAVIREHRPNIKWLRE